MKGKVLVLVLIIIGILLPSQLIFAQPDTTLVEWQNEDGDVIVNNLRTTIIEDTTESGERIPRVYKLKRGGLYHITDPIENIDTSLTIIGETYEESDLAEEGKDDWGPAVIQRVAREDGSSPSGTMFRSQHDLTLKNLYVLGETDNGVVANYALMKIQGNDKTYEFDNVVFDRNRWFYPEVSGDNNDVYITNCKFRNVHGSTQIWEGRGISFLGTADTVVIENNTFMNLGCFIYQQESAPANYVRINHNTIVNLGRQLQSTFWKQAYVTNNLIVNGFWNGESYDQYSDPSREDPYTGVFSIGALPGQYGTNFGREILLANNSHWRDPSFESFYENAEAPDGTTLDNPIRPQPFINDTTQGYFDQYDNMVKKNNYLDEKPELTTPVPDSVLNFMKQHIVDLYNNETTNRYDWDESTGSYIFPPWPLHEDFTYSNETLKSGGTDGLPLGDLNWYPEKKKDFENNKAQYVSEIEDMAEAPDLEVMETFEAENMTLDGDGSVYTVPEDKTYFNMEGSGSITWNFDLSESDTYKLIVYTRSGNSERGQIISLNGTDLRNDSEYGGWYWSNLPENFWLETEINSDKLIEDVEGSPLELEGGSHTLVIKPSWGYQEFQKVEVVNSDGEVVKNLTPPKAEYEQVAPMAEDVDWVPSGFKAAILNAGASISGNFESDFTGQYRARVYFAADGSQSVDFQVNGETIENVALEDTSDTFTGYFQLDKGSNSFAVSSENGNVSIDKVQFIADMATGISNNNVPDNEFTLKNNYPNPFNPTTNIEFRLKNKQHIKLTIYNIMGQKVKTLVNREVESNRLHRIKWNGKNSAGQHVSSGIYFYRLKSLDGTIDKTAKMTLLK